MKKLLVSIVLTVCFCASCWGAPLLTADDFMPVVQAPEEQREELLTVQHPEEVKTEVDPELNKPVTRAATAQDAINSVMQRFYADGGDGCESVALPDGSLGLSRNWNLRLGDEQYRSPAQGTADSLLHRFSSS